MDERGKMNKPYKLEEHEAYRKQQDDKAAKADQDRKERTEKATARRAWIADGGRASDFEAAWSRLRDDARKQRVLSADRAAREAHRSAGTSRI